MLFSVLVASGFAFIVVLWIALQGAKGQYGVQSLYAFSQTIGADTYVIEFLAERNRSDLYVHAEFPNVGVWELRLTFLVLLQTEIVLFFWWRVRTRGPEQHLAAFAKRLFKYAGINYLLCLVSPTTEDNDYPISGFGSVFHWPRAMFEGYLEIADYISYLCLFLAMVSVPIVFALRFLEFPFRSTAGHVVVALLFMNALLLTAHTFVGKGIDVTYGIVLLGLANACCAFAVWTKMIQRKRFDAKWQAALEARPM